MQINTLPQPILNNASVTPQAVTQALPQVQALAAAPLTQRAVAPSSKDNRGGKPKSNSERFSGGEETPTLRPENTRGHFVNTSA